MGDEGVRSQPPWPASILKVGNIPFTCRFLTHFLDLLLLLLVLLLLGKNTADSQY